MRRIFIILGLLLWTVSAGTGAEYKLTSGEIVAGDLVIPTANDQGVQVKIGEGQYQKIPWTSFSQEDLKGFAKNSKLETFVQPFIEVDPHEKIKKTEVNIKEPPRLTQPPKQSLLGAMFASGFGLFMLFLLYAANIYAAYEVSIFRAQPPGLVCGLAAIPVLGFLATPTFLALPTRIKPGDQAELAPAAAIEGGMTETAETAVNPMQAEGATHPGGLKIHTEEAAAKPTLPETVTYQRGQFTFNRRFFETKFAGFFGVVRRDAEKDKVIVFKTTRGEYIGQRISRIAANDLHVQVQRGHASEEVLVPFQEIQEIKVQHKDV